MHAAAFYAKYLAEDEQRFANHEAGCCTRAHPKLTSPPRYIFTTHPSRAITLSIKQPLECDLTFTSGFNVEFLTILKPFILMD